MDCARFLAEVAPFLFFPDEENNPGHNDHTEQKSQGLDAPELSAVAGSSNVVPPVPQGDVVIMSSSPQTAEIRHAAADRRFLEELGLTPQAFRTLLDGTGVEWDDDDDDDDDEGEGEGEDEEDEEWEEEGEVEEVVGGRGEDEEDQD